MTQYVHSSLVTLKIEILSEWALDSQYHLNVQVFLGGNGDPEAKP